MGTPVKSKDQNSAFLLACKIFHQRVQIVVPLILLAIKGVFTKYKTGTAALTNASRLLQQQHIPKQTVLVKIWRCLWEK